MKKEIRVADEKRGIIQVTTTDERWYVKESEDPKTKLPIYKYVPSSTWICNYYPKGIQFYKWLAEKGWDESQLIKEQAGARGSKVHKAVETLIAGETITLESKFLNTRTEEQEELTVDEYEAVMSFVDWYNSLEEKEVVACEIAVWNDKYNYAGTVDLVMKIKDKKTGAIDTWVIDIKTGQNIWKEYELQISSYKHALKLDQEPRLAVLQLGYRRNKSLYKFTEIKDCFNLFLVAREIWAVENSDEKPKQRDYPVALTLVEEEPQEDLQANSENHGEKQGDTKEG